MLDELNQRIEQAYINGDLEYFHNKQFIQDLAALGLGLSDLFSSVCCAVENKDGVLEIKSIWPDLELKLISKTLKQS